MWEQPAGPVTKGAIMPDGSVREASLAAVPLGSGTAQELTKRLFFKADGVRGAVYRYRRRPHGLTLTTSSPAQNSS